MKKYAVVLAVVWAVVWPVLVLAQEPILEWSAGDTCIWRRNMDGVLTCTSEGIYVYPDAYYDSDTHVYTGDPTWSPLPEMIDIPVYVNSFGPGCSNTQLFFSGPTNVRISLSSLPQIISSPPDDNYLFIENYDDTNACYITSIRFGGEPDSEPPSPGAGSEILTGFNVSEIFTIAGTLINALFNVIAVIAGVYLAFKVVSWIIGRMRG